MNGSVISAMHYCIPSKRLTNKDLAERFGDKTIRSIVNMAGIEERRVVASGQCASDLAFCAADRLLNERAIDRKSIDLLVFASETPDYQIPPTACVLHERLGLSERCASFDINLGCSAFPYSLGVVHSMIAAGLAHRALLLVADAITGVLHPKDRGLIPLHGDGGTASLVEACAAGTGNIAFFLGTSGVSHRHLMIPASGARTPRSEATKKEIDDNGIIRTAEHMYMNGPAVFSFSLHKVPDAIRSALDLHRLTMDDIDVVLLHQANKTMVDQIYKVLNVPAHKRFYHMKDIGNCAAASSPILLAEALRQGVVKPGSTVLVAGFGVGLSWGIAIMRWPKDLDASIDASFELDDASA